MSGHQLLQFSDARPDQGAGRFDGRDGSAEIVGQHLVTLLRREQAALRQTLGLQNLTECRALQLIFPASAFVVRHRSILLG